MPVQKDAAFQETCTARLLCSVLLCNACTDMYTYLLTLRNVPCVCGLLFITCPNDLN